MRLIEKVWFYQHQAKWFLVPLLLPLSLLFMIVSWLRRRAYSLGVFKSYSAKLPVIVIGNIGIGGNGKTPVALYLIEQCIKKGIKVGVISRGYGGIAPYYPYIVNEKSTAEQVGDEPLLIFQRFNIPVVVGSDRVASAELLAEQSCELIIADDGLQHYRLERDIELIVIDNKRRFGNGFLLPAGPLRELKSRLKQVDGIIINGQHESACTGFLPEGIPAALMELKVQKVVNVKNKASIKLHEFLKLNENVNAMAGIGDPQRFFTMLEQLGFCLEQAKGFIDHEKYTEDKLNVFPQSTPLLMTEKDAVKCDDFAQDNWWYLPVDASFSSEDITVILNKMFSTIKR